jgi:hypothetical protein
VGATQVKGVDVICGCLCRRRVVPVMDANSFQAHSCLCSPFLLFYYFIAFLFVQELIRGHCLGMVTRADSVTHKYFHKDEKVGS